MVVVANEKEYIEKLEYLIINKISSLINNITVNSIVNDDLNYHLKNNKSIKFQKFYFETISNENFYFNTNNFFNQFKQQYSLQAIDNQFLARLESEKKDILEKIKSNKLTQLYFNTFRNAELIHNNQKIERDLGSFFAKLVHTFQPDNYCALDNPIKEYFGLSKESFFISFVIISNSYKQWAESNFDLIKSIKEKFLNLDNCHVFEHNKITDLKILDLIFWKKAQDMKILQEKK